MLSTIMHDHEGMHVWYIDMVLRSCILTLYFYISIPHIGHYPGRVGPVEQQGA